MEKIPSTVIPDIGAEKCISTFFVNVNADMVLLKNDFTSIWKLLNISYIFFLYFHNLK